MYTQSMVKLKVTFPINYRHIRSRRGNQTGFPKRPLVFKHKRGFPDIPRWILSQLSWYTKSKVHLPDIGTYYASIEKQECQNHRPQTNPRHREEETQIRNWHTTVKVKHPQVFKHKRGFPDIPRWILSQLSSYNKSKVHLNVIGTYYASIEKQECHNHRTQSNQRHREEETQNTDWHTTVKVKHPQVFKLKGGFLIFPVGF